MYDPLDVPAHGGLCPCYRCLPANRDAIAYRRLKHVRDPASRVVELEKLIWDYTRYHGDPFLPCSKYDDAHRALLREGMFIWRTNPDLH